MPASAHHFIPVWQPLDAEKTYRSKSYAPTKKRKRQNTLNDSDSDSDANGDHGSPYSSPPESHHRPSRRDTLNKLKDPHHVAGHSQHRALPPHPFPHAPLPKPRQYASPETTQKHLAALNPPLYVPPPTTTEGEDTKTSLRRHHLAVMTTIMHTALLKRDFIRAGRAWGLILRSEVFGRPTDVRTHDRWGIGAEILLQQHARLPSSKPLDDQDYHDNDDNDDIESHGEAASHDMLITDQGFQLAKDYYDRLILQYPFQKTAPKSTSSLTFYPAMYSLCLVQLQQTHRLALRKAESGTPSRTPTPDSTNDDNDDSDLRNPSDARVADVKKSTLNPAIALADRMTELMLSPPYDAHLPLLQLRAMLALWIIDLVDHLATRDPRAADEYAVKIGAQRAAVRRYVSRVKKTGGELPEGFTLDDV